MWTGEGPSYDSHLIQRRVRGYVFFRGDVAHDVVPVTAYFWGSDRVQIKACQDVLDEIIESEM